MLVLHLTLIHMLMVDMVLVQVPMPTRMLIHMLMDTVVAEFVKLVMVGSLVTDKCVNVTSKILLLVVPPCLVKMLNKR